MTRTATVTSGLLLLVACGDGLRAARLRAPSTPADTRRCTRSRVVSRAADDEAEVDRVLAGLQLEEDGGSDSRKYMPSTGPDDPIARALRDVCGAREVLSLDLLDSRWNGNEVLRYETDAGRFFVKMNRVEDVSVFMMEAVSLTALIKAGAVRAPKPLHLGPLPRVGDFGPGAFMVLEYLDMKPFGSMQKETQRALGEQLAALHGSRAHDSVHQGRYGFVVNNFLALTPLNNTWADEWHTFFAGRLRGQLDSLHSAKAYAKAPMSRETAEPLLERGARVIELLPALLAEPRIDGPSLLHGDLWIGNTGATKESGEPVFFDPACFFGHAEFDLALPRMFGGFDDNFFDAYHGVRPKAPGFDQRQKLYELYQYLNQLNLFGDAAVYTKCRELMDEVLAASRA